MDTGTCINTWLERLPLQSYINLYIHTYVRTSNLHVCICVFVSIPTLYMYLHMYGRGIWGTNIILCNRVTSTATYLRTCIHMWWTTLYPITTRKQQACRYVPYRHRATIRLLLLITTPFIYVRTTQRDQGPMGNTMNVTLIL